MRATSHPTTMSLCIAATLLLALLFDASSVFAEAPAIDVELSRPSIFEGESVLFTVLIKNVKNPPAPKLEGYENFRVEVVEDRQIDSQKIVSINGVRRVYEQQGRQLVYKLTPLKAGILNLPAPRAEIDGDEVFGQSMQLTVKVPEEQDSAVLDISIDPPTVYPTQTFVVKLVVAIKQLPEPLETEDPIASLSDPPRLQIPWADDDGIPKGLVPIMPWQRWLGPLQSRRGFNINDIADPNSLSVFASRRAKFHVEPTQRGLTVNGKRNEYWEYTFSRTLEAETPGTYDLGRAVFKGKLVRSIVGQSRAQMDSIFAISAATTVKVKDVPESGRPANYAGVVGKLQAEASLVPTTAKVGDPMTLTLRLHGSGTVANATAPDLTAIPDIASAFKVYDATEELRGDDRVFTYRVRPQHERVTELAAIPLSYFDPFNEQFVETHTVAIPLTVEPAESVGSNEIAVASPSNQKSKVLLSEDGIYANITDLGSVKNQRVNPTSWLIAFGSIVSGYFVGLFAIRSVTRRVNDVQGNRRRKAVGVAQAALQDHSQISAPSSDTGKETADTISAALVGLVADLIGEEPQGLTSQDAIRLLEQRNVEPNVVGELSAVLDTCDAARYGGAAGSPSEWVQQSLKLIDRIAAELGAAS
jgi:hypothetical protein